MPPTIPDPTPFSNSAGAAAFWLMTAIVVVAWTMAPVLRRREGQKTIRQLAEKGQPLDAAMVERLLQADPAQHRERNPWAVPFIVLAAGPGIAIMGYFVGKTDPDASAHMYGAGALITLIGVAFLLAALVRPRGRRSSSDGGNLEG